MGKRFAICVSTSKPSASLTPGGGGGCINLVCPHTGSILSSMRTTGDNASKTVLGLSSLSAFPNRNFPSLLMAYGGTTSRKEDTYGMLLTLQSLSSPPLLNWKCRLPGQLSAGINVSPCGHYLVAGGASGNIYVWSSLGGLLLRTVKAHYRSVAAMSWTDCASYLVTGGADGMIHVFSLMDLVDRETMHDNNNNNTNVAPIRSWSVHHLPVTALHPLESGRIVSASKDGQIVLMEVFSEKTLATFQMPNGIQSLAYHGWRLYAGSVQGVIYMLDLNVYAMQQTAQLGVTVKRRRIQQDGHEEQVYVTDSSSNKDLYKSELCGHERTVTSLAIVAEDDGAWLVSGDDVGTLRVWDLDSRGCVRIIQPWSHSARTTTTNEKEQAKSSSSSLHPVTSIVVVPRDENDESSATAAGAFSISRSKESKANSITSLITPLQRFPDGVSGKADNGMIPVPFMQPKRDRSTLFKWQQEYKEHETPVQQTASTVGSTAATPANSRQKETVQGATQSNTQTELEEQRNEVQRLQRELAEAKTTIARWEKVSNNTLTPKT